MSKRIVIFKAAVVMATLTACLDIPSLLAQTGAPICDEQQLLQARQEFQRLRDKQRMDPSSVSEAELRGVSNLLINEAEICYAALYGSDAPSAQKIDDGGVWAHGSGSLYGKSDQVRPKHNLTGNKWGAGTSFLTCCDNPDATGPRLAGGTVSYSFMADAIDLEDDCGMGCTNTAVASLATFDMCMLEEISNAFGIWSASANITFVPVTDGGGAFDTEPTGDIRIGAHAFDGASGILAHAFFPPPNGTFAAGDLHFDIAEPWSCDPTLGGIDIGIVALHEIGHSIGLGHEASDPAVMEAFYNPALTFGLLADDIIGAGQTYGTAGAATTAFFGNLGLGTDAPDKQLHLVGDSSSAASANKSAARIENISATKSNRHMLTLINRGAPQLIFTDSSKIQGSWQLNPTNGGDFTFSKNGSGVLELVLEPGGDLTIAGMLTQNSDRGSKENFQPVEGKQILDKLVTLPVTTWNFIRADESERHIGPMAQDFFALFALGQDDVHLAPSDLSGVTLAAIQGLYQLIQEQKAEIDELKTQLEALRKRDKE